MEKVRAKKHLGQHFLTDPRIAGRIVEGLQPAGAYTQVLEVGPGMGILSDHLLQRKELESFLVDVDVESFNYLKTRYTELGERLLNADFLAMNFADVFPGKMGIIGNFPYNISSQIMFKVLDNRDKVVEVVGMFQKEVAERCVAKPGGKEYGILSVLLQAWYTGEYLFTVKAGSFNPPPKVLSGVIRLRRNETDKLDCDEKLFWQVVKAGFNQRRKTLRNALSSVMDKNKMGDEPLLERRAETLTVQDFVYLTQKVAASRIPEES